MIEVHYVSGGVWILGGLFMCLLGYLIRFRGRSDILEYDPERADPVQVANWVGPTALLMGIVTIGYGIREATLGFDPTALTVFLVSLLVLMVLVKVILRGWIPPW